MSNGDLTQGRLVTTFAMDSSPDGLSCPDDVLEGTSGADSYHFDNARGGSSVGDKMFTDFGRADSLLASSRIFDVNNDGFIVLGPNGRLDVERSSKTNAGSAQFSLINEAGETIHAVRELGRKDGADLNASWVYADAATLTNLINHHNDGTDGLLDQANGRQVNVIEGTVGDDALGATDAVDFFLFDTALALDLGRDTITGFGAGDCIVTTSDDWNADGSDLTLLAPASDALLLLGSEMIGGTTYFYYGFPTI